MNTEAEKREKMMEFFRKNAYNPLTITPQEFKKKEQNNYITGGKT